MGVSFRFIQQMNAHARRGAIKHVSLVFLYPHCKVRALEERGSPYLHKKMAAITQEHFNISG